MAKDNELWFELGVRDHVTGALGDILAEAERVAEEMEGLLDIKPIYENALKIEKAYDNISKALQKIDSARSNLKAGDSRIDSLKKMEESLKNIRSIFESIASSDAKLGTKGYVSFQEKKTGLELAIKQVADYTKGIRELEKEEEKQSSSELNNKEELKKKYYELKRIQEDWLSALNNAPQSSVKGGDKKISQSLGYRLEQVKKAMDSGGTMPSSASGADAAEFIRRAKERTRELVAESENYERKLKLRASLLSSIEKIMEDTASKARIADTKGETYRADALRAQYQQLKSIYDLTKGGGYSEEEATKAIERSQREYNEAVARGEAADRRAIAAKKEKKEADDAAARASDGLVNAFDKVTAAGNRQGKMMRELTNMVSTYFSLYTFRNIGRDVITRGGDFEVQRVALQNILGDLKEANLLFSQLKDLALESPMTFRQLSGYTKQLAAFSIPSNELFDTTKRLADMSTGLGVDMSRLILAYGQVRSAAVLRGQELRQFTEAGIPLVKRLAEEFTKLNGEVVNTGDVFELIQKRKVSFEMVQKILWDMTNEGGQFYDMQSKIADTLAGKWQKLSDAYEIMLGRLADGSTVTGSVLKQLLTTTTYIINNIEKALPLITSMGAAFGSKKIIYGIAGFAEANAGAVEANIKAAQRENALLIQREATLGRIKQTYAQKLLEENKIFANSVRTLVNAGRLNTLELTGLYHKKLINKELVEQLVLEKAITQEEAKQILTTSKMGLFGKQIGDSLKGIFSTANLATLGIGLVIGSLMSFIGHLNEADEIAKQMRESITQGAKDMVSSSRDLLSNYSGGTSFNTVSEYTNAIGVMTEYLKENASSWDSVKNASEGAGEGLEGAKKRYEELHERVKAVNEANKMIADDPDFLNRANDKTGVNWWIGQNDELDAALKRIQDSFNNSEQAIRNVLADDDEKISEVLSNIRKNYLEFAMAVKGQGIEKSLKEQLALLRDFPEARKMFNKAFSDKNGTIIPESSAATLESFFAGYETQWELIQAKVLSFSDDLKKKLKEYDENVDFSNLNATQEEFVMRTLDNFFKQYNITSERVIQDFKKRLNTTGFNINVKVSTEGEEKLTGWKKELNELTGKRYEVEIEGFSNIVEATEFFKKKYEELKKEIETSKPIAISAGFVIDNKSGQFVWGKNGTSTDNENAYGFNSPWRNIAKNAADTFNEALKASNAIKEVEKLGIDTSDWGKDKNKNRSGGSKVDKELNDWKKRISLLEKYRQKLDELSKYMSRSDAEKKLREGGNFASLWNFGDPNDFAGYLRGAIAKLGKKGERGNYANELMAKIEDDLLREFTKNADDAVSELRKLLDVMRENYDVYKKWVEMTGDEALAASIAGVARNSSLADLLKSKYDELGGIGGMSADDFFALSESDAKKRGGDKSEYFALWQEWDKNEKKIRSERLKTYEEAYKSAKSYEDRITDINRQLEREIANLDAIQDISDSERARLKENLRNNAGKKIADETWKQFKENSDYGRVFGDLNNMSTTTLEAMRDELLKYAPSVSESVEATKALYEALDKIDKLLLERNPFNALANAMNVQAGIKKFLEDFADADLDTTINLDAKSAKRYGLGDGSRAWSGTKSSAIDALEKSGNEASKALGGIANKFKDVQKVLQPVIDLFAQLGNTTLSDFFNTGSNVIGSAVSVFEGINGIKGMFKPESGIASLLGSAAPYAAAAGAAVSLISSIVAMHDASLQREIEASQQRQKEMENLTKNLETALSRTLGGVYSTEAGKGMLSALQKEIRYSGLFGEKLGYRSYIGQDTIAAVKEAEKSRSYYDTTYASLLAQRDELQHQMRSEEAKKDSDGGKIADYKQQLTEMEDQIKHFAEDMAKALYDIDVKSWASELGDALFEAWQKGEDGAEAFKKKASEIIANVAKKIAVTKLIETAMKPVLDVITSEMEATDGKLNEQSIAKISSQMAVVGQTLPGAFNSLMDGLDEGLKKGGLDSMKEDAKKEGSISNTIKGITEDTAGLLASYINAIRADVSLNRVSLADIQMSVAMLREMPAIAEAQLRQLEQIVANTGATAVNTAAIREIYDLLHGNTLGQNYLRVK